MGIELTPKYLDHIFDTYFKNKETYDDLEKASYAYHITWHENTQAHYFFHKYPKHNLDDYADHKFKSEQCEWCKRTRYDIRWDNQPAHCSQRPQKMNKYVTMSVENIIQEEEQNYYALLHKAENGEIEKVLHRKFNNILTAEALVYLQTTLGFEPDIVSTILNLDIEHLMTEYESLMNQHKQLSGKFQK